MATGAACRSWRVAGAVPSGGRSVGDLGAAAILLAVLGALAGGMLLNLMPCVFPILALKGVAPGAVERRQSAARRDALGYAAGAVVGTGLLGVALLAIRAGAAPRAGRSSCRIRAPSSCSCCWPRRSRSICCARSSLPVLAGEARPAGSFGNRRAGRFVATPCAGPFLGAALGTALLLPVAGSVLVFAALGLGLPCRSS